MAHTLGGGGAPSPILLLAVALLASPLCLLLVGRRLSIPGTAVAVLAAQALFHLAFAVTASASSAALSETSHAHHAVTLAASAGAPVISADPLMVLHHLTAAFVTVVLLHRGERMLRAVGRGISALVPAITEPISLERRVAPQLVALTPAAPRHPLFSSDLVLRGPPTV